MKTILFTAILLFSSNAFTRELNCKITSNNNEYYMPSEFQLIDIDEQFPEVSDFDGGNMADIANPLVFSNECDNWMEINFPVHAFDMIRAGEISKVSGSIYYSSAELDESSPSVVASPYNDGEYMVIMQIECEI